MSSCYWIFQRIFRCFYKIYNRLDVSGGGNVPKHGGVIVVANHMSFLDPPLVGAALDRRATFLAREGLFKIPFVGKFVASFSVPVRRDSPQPSTIKEAVKRLKAGGLVVMFPQGSRALSADSIDIKRGVELIARLSGARIVPALVMGTDRALPVGGRFIKPAKLRVRFGEPLDPSDDMATAVASAFERLKAGQKAQ